jgi:hypothetical protein
MRVACSAPRETLHCPWDWLQRWPVSRQGTNGIWPHVTVRPLRTFAGAGASIPVNGTFGSHNRAAVVASLRNDHRVVGGVVGSRTWRSLIITVGHDRHGGAVRAGKDQIQPAQPQERPHRGLFRGLRAEGPSCRDGFRRELALDIKAFEVDGIVGPIRGRRCSTRHFVEGAVDAYVTREEFPYAIRQVSEALSSNALARLRGHAEDGRYRRLWTRPLTQNWRCRILRASSHFR